MPRQNSFPKVKVLDIDIDIVTIGEAVEFITSEAKTGPARYISKPYVEFYDGKLSKRTDPTGTETGLVELLNDAYMCLPEGVAVQWAAYYQTTSGSLWQLFKTLAEIVIAPGRIRSVVPEKFGGTNFTWPLLEVAASKNLSVYLIGSPVKNDIQHTADFLRKNIGGLDIAGTSPGRDPNSGVFSAALEAELLRDLKRKKPDIILIGIGFPRQEYLARKLSQKLDHGVFIGEGGTFDYRQFGGKFKKAPRLMQAFGLEWLWRLALEPKRIKRQLAIPRFIKDVYKFTKRRRTSYHKARP